MHQHLSYWTMQSINDIDQIVAGTKGRRRDDRAFLGSVTEEVVQSAKCPILIINDSTKFENIESKNNILVPIDFSISAGYQEKIK